MTDEPWMRGLHTDTGYLLHRIGLRAGSLFNSALEQHGLRLRHYALLRYLATAEGVRQREISDRLGYDPSAVVGLVDDLQRLGLAERRPDPGDRRNRIVVLTRAGRDLLRDSDHDAARVTEQLLEPLGEEERRQLQRLLLRVAGLDPA
ncbi:MarR family transcriptional regulator [Streptomyces sp. TRM 70361]|uniref:MarR family winged helix-turn-helix transcriptional regulator n=1 Tax=Streptomyces sp. TRM 70361 TaxID=3116553 RepID=UPI002E7AC236|nr:MarR family transcriptional regulator [Streptomyces sp. TRM 70361]MEE1943202.1 MarR family transcriptional regulator [Streptomyces sp. TRM 70361]